MYDENGEHIPEDPWSSVVDLMSALVLVLFLAVIFFITNYSEVSEELAAEQVILQQRSADLEKTRQSLVSAQESNVDLMWKNQYRTVLEKQRDLGKPGVLALKQIQDKKNKLNNYL